MKLVLRHPLFVTIFGTVLGTVIATYLVSYINSISMLNALKAVYSFILNVIVTVLSFNVPIYVILLLIILFSLVLIFIKKLIYSIKEDKDSPLNYKEDKIEDVRWVWDWIDVYGRNDFRGNTPVPLCNHCKGNLIEKDFNYDYFLYCEHCEYKKKIPEGYKDYQEKIKREIYRRLRVKFDL